MESENFKQEILRKVQTAGGDEVQEDLNYFAHHQTCVRGPILNCCQMFGNGIYGRAKKIFNEKYFCLSCNFSCTYKLDMNNHVKKHTAITQPISNPVFPESISQSRMKFINDALLAEGHDELAGRLITNQDYHDTARDIMAVLLP